jgi:hypothetical protein
MTSKLFSTCLTVLYGPKVSLKFYELLVSALRFDEQDGYTLKPYRAKPYLAILDRSRRLRLKFPLQIGPICRRCLLVGSPQHKSPGPSE